MKKVILIFSVLLLVASSCKTKKEVIAKEDNKIYEAHELKQAATYPGGEIAQAKFFHKNLVYPPLSIETGSQGKIYVNFVVEKDGTTTQHKIVRAFNDKACEAECLRVIKLMKFAPAIKNNKQVRSKLTLPIIFKLR